MNNNRYLPFALVALAASVLGYGASTLMNRETTSAMTGVQTLPVTSSPAAAGMQPNAQPIAPLALQPLQQQALAPMAVAGTAAQQPAQVLTTQEAAAPVVHSAPVRTRTARPAAAENEAASAAVNPAPVRKKGMSNKTKTVIAIGGAAGLGAAIGGIAGGGKGAAIGALAGAGAGTAYSVIRHKQKKPVF